MKALNAIIKEDLEPERQWFLGSQALIWVASRPRELVYIYNKINLILQDYYMITIRLELEVYIT